MIYSTILNTVLHLMMIGLKTWAKNKNKIYLYVSNYKWIFLNIYFNIQSAKPGEVVESPNH